MDAIKDQLAETRQKLESSKETESTLKNECFESRRRWEDAKESVDALKSKLMESRRKLENANESLNALKQTLSETRIKLQQSQMTQSVTMSANANAAAAAATADDQKGPLYETEECDMNPYLTLDFGAPHHGTTSNGETMADPLVAFVDALEEKANDDELQFAEKENAANWSCEEVAYWLTTIGMKKYLAQFIEQFVDGQILLHDLNSQNLVHDLKVKSLHSPKIMRGIKALKTYCAPIVAPGTPEAVDRHQIRGRTLMLEMVDLVTTYHFESGGQNGDIMASLKAKISGLELENEEKAKFIEKLNRRIARRNDRIHKLNDELDRISDRPATTTQNGRRGSLTLNALPLNVMMNGNAPRTRSASTQSNHHHHAPTASDCSVIAAAADVAPQQMVVVDESQNVMEHKVDSSGSAQSEDPSKNEDRYKSMSQNGTKGNISTLSPVEEDETESKEPVESIKENASKVQSADEVDSEDDMDSLFAAVWQHAEDEEEGTEGTAPTGFMGKLYSKFVGKKEAESTTTTINKKESESSSASRRNSTSHL